MAEYIEREAAVKAFNNFDAGRADSPPFTLLTPEEFAEYLYELPAADVAPVVLCKDCEKSVVTEFGKRYCKEPMGSFFGCIPVEDDYFCSGGRRKDGGDG